MQDLGAWRVEPHAAALGLEWSRLFSVNDVETKWGVTSSLLVQCCGPFVAFYLDVASSENYVTSGGDHTSAKSFQGRGQ